MNRKSTLTASKQLDLVALLAALAVFLSLVEYAIPKPIPFLKIGLANLPVLIGLQILSPAYFFLLVLMKILAQGLVNGTLISYVILFSFSGSLASAGLMFTVARLGKKHISLVGISLMGALASNLVQIVLARFLVFGPAAWLLAPPFILVGIIASLFLGLFARRFYHQSTWVKRVTQTLE